jgi:hypothetical protein
MNTLNKILCFFIGHKYSSQRIKTQFTISHCCARCKTPIGFPLYWIGAPMHSKCNIDEWNKHEQEMINSLMNELISAPTGYYTVICKYNNEGKTCSELFNKIKECKNCDLNKHL